MGQESKPRTVKCPQCKKEALFSPENKFRPFCSERCRLIDLGAWASEDYRVPLEKQTPDLENEETPTDQNPENQNDSDAH